MCRRKEVPDTGHTRWVTGWEPRVGPEETLHRVIAYCAEVEEGEEVMGGPDATRTPF